MDKDILHCDLNGFYASVECMLNPELENKSVAVCGAQEDRLGVVLARNEKAKKMGVKTGETVVAAQGKCPDLTIVPPNFANYTKYSQLTRDIYSRFTDRVEAFGIDECWLDVTGSNALFGSSEEIAHQIRETVKKELGLTISVGVSFNKIFAKLASDMVGPDSVMCIKREAFKDEIWKLPAERLLGVGAKTKEKLGKYSIKTIGEIAGTNLEFMKIILGKNGTKIWYYANGLDNSPVVENEQAIPKSIGHSVTCRTDLVNPEEVWCVFLELSQKVSQRLRASNLFAKGIQISIKDNDFKYKEYQEALEVSSCSYHEIAEFAFEIFRKKHRWANNIRAVGVRAIDLGSQEEAKQYSLFSDNSEREKINKLEETIETIRKKYGEDSINNAVLMVDSKT